jgi:RimJ/RimL family protein N-acetyltransferase
LRVTSSTLSDQIPGQRIELVRSAPVHAEQIHTLLQDKAFWRLFRSNQKLDESISSIRQRLEREVKIPLASTSQMEWLIFDRSSKQRDAPIGLATLADFHPTHKKAEFLLGIPDPSDRAAGKSLEAALLLLDFSFNQLRLNKLVSLVYCYNIEAQKNTERLGFQREGLLRAHFWNNHLNSVVDVYQNGLLEQDFRSQKRLSKLSKRLLKRDITRATETRATHAQSVSSDQLRALNDALHFKHR